MGEDEEEAEDWGDRAGTSIVHSRGRARLSVRARRDWDWLWPVASPVPQLLLGLQLLPLLALLAASYFAVTGN